MSSRDRTEVEVEQLTYPCGFCGAESGAWCTTTSGREAQFLHSDRYYQWIDNHGRE